MLGLGGNFPEEKQKRIEESLTVFEIVVKPLNLFYNFPHLEDQ